MVVLQQQGPINDLIVWLGWAADDNRPELMYNVIGTFVAMTQILLPFMILPLYANMEKLDSSLNEAAADLGSGPINTFFKITLPLSMPGIIAGSLLVFIPATGEYVIPDLLGGGNVQMIGRQLYNEFARNIDWPVASAVAIVLLLLLVLPMAIYQHYQAKAAEVK